MTPLLLAVGLVLTVLYPWIALTAILAACAGLGLLIIRAARGRVYPSNWSMT